MPHVTVLRPVVVQFDALHLVVPVRYGEDDMPRDFPGRRGDTWNVTLDLPEGGPAKLRDWPGPALYLYMKVTDEGSYSLLDTVRNITVTVHKDYVPSFLGESGDYLVLNIAADGTILNWPQRPEYRELFPQE